MAAVEKQREERGEALPVVKVVTSGSSKLVREIRSGQADRRNSRREA